MESDTEGKGKSERAVWLSCSKGTLTGVILSARSGSGELSARPLNGARVACRSDFSASIVSSSYSSRLYVRDGSAESESRRGSKWRFGVQQGVEIAQVCGVPLALLSSIDGDSLPWMIARGGCNCISLRGLSFCGRAARVTFGGAGLELAKELPVLHPTWSRAGSVCV